MKHISSKGIYEHLEFLGYTMKLDDQGDDYDTFHAHSSSRGNLYVRSNETVMLLRSFWVGLDSRALRSKSFHDKLNILNSSNIAVKCYYEGSEDTLTLVVSAVNFGSYNKPDFATFIESVSDGIASCVQGMQEFLKAS